jgi:hypothetical protein
MVLVAALATALLLRPFSGGPTSGPSRGLAIFEGKAVSGMMWTCTACHTATTAPTSMGPGLGGVGTKGEDHLRESIIDPSKSVLPGYLDQMPKTFARELCGRDTNDSRQLADCQNLNDLVAFLLTLKT